MRAAKIENTFWLTVSKGIKPFFLGQQKSGDMVPLINVGDFSVWRACAV